MLVVTENPNTSMRQIVREQEIIMVMVNSYGRVQTILSNNKLYPYYAQLHQQLNYEAFQWRISFCQWPQITINHERHFLCTFLIVYSLEMRRYSIKMDI